MKGANKYYGIITRAFQRKLGGLEATKLGYTNHGGNAKCYRKENVLYVLSDHARGYTFFVYLIGEDGELFKVYGITDGNPGWTETYGWLHKGTWVTPILRYLRDLEREIVAYDERIAEDKRQKEREQNRVIAQKVDKFNRMFREASV